MDHIVGNLMEFTCLQNSIIRFAAAKTDHGDYRESSYITPSFRLLSPQVLFCRMLHTQAGFYHIAVHAHTCKQFGCK
jgi:hypothetical protein